MRAAILPDWWQPECERDPDLLADVEIRLARFLHLPLQLLKDPAATLTAPAYANARLRRVAKEGAPPPTATIHAALSVVRAALRNLRAPLPPPVALPADPLRWHRELARGGGALLEAGLADLWRRGIPVIQIATLPSPRFQGLACILDGRPFVLIGHDIDMPARLFSHLAHEAGHIAAGDCAEDAPVIDEDDEVQDRSQIERAADRYAVIAALGEQLPEPPGSTIMEDFQRLARTGATQAKARHLDAGSLLWHWAVKTREFSMGTLSIKAIYKHLGGARAIRAKFDEYVDIDSASDSDRALLRCVKGDPDTNASPR